MADWNVRVLILTTFDPDEYLDEALRAGASGFVLKDLPAEQLATAVRTVADGRAGAGVPCWHRPSPGASSASSRDAAPSTVRSRDAWAASPTGSVKWWCGGVGPATRRSLRSSSSEPPTVKSHLSSILAKIGLRDRARVVVFAYESGLVEAGEHDIGR